MTRPAKIPVEDVAEIVRNWPRPAGFTPYIAEKYGVPVGTARRWVQVARQRGLLESGTLVRPCRLCGGTGVGKAWNNGSRWEPTT